MFSRRHSLKIFSSDTTRSLRLGKEGDLYFVLRRIGCFRVIHILQWRKLDWAADLAEIFITAGPQIGLPDPTECVSPTSTFLPEDGGRSILRNVVIFKVSRFLKLEGKKDDT
jgi:hypothetical protein